jgi:hypothetical protein
MRRYLLALTAALVLVIGAFWMNKSSTGPPPQHGTTLNPNELNRLRLH